MLFLLSIDSLISNTERRSRLYDKMAKDLDENGAAFLKGGETSQSLSLSDLFTLKDGAVTPILKVKFATWDIFYFIIPLKERQGKKKEKILSSLFQKWCLWLLLCIGSRSPGTSQCVVSQPRILTSYLVRFHFSTSIICHIYL